LTPRSAETCGNADFQDTARASIIPASFVDLERGTADFANRTDGDRMMNLSAPSELSAVSSSDLACSMNVWNLRFAGISGERWAVAVLLLVTLVVRGGAMWAMRDKLADDPDAYREIAENLLRHGIYGLGKDGPPRPTAYRPPLYPIVLSNLPAADGASISLAKVAVLHVLLGVATVLLTYLTARRLLRGAGVSPAKPSALSLAPFLAALLVAFDPILLNQQSLVMTETLAAFLAVLSLWLLARFDARRDWFSAGLAGGAIGLAALCRPTFLPWLGLVAVGLLAVRGGQCGVRNAECGVKERKGRGWKDVGWRLANGAALVVVAAGVISPWAIRNQREFGKPIVTTTHGGYTLYLGNNGFFFGWLRQDRSGLPYDAEAHGPALAAAIQEMSPAPPGRWELVVDQTCHNEAWINISAQPFAFLAACGYRVRQLWSPLPYKLSADESTSRMLLRYATAAWYCGVYVLAAVGVWRSRWQFLKPPWVWGVLLCLTFTAVHTLYWCNLRMRAPLMPFVAVIAAAAFVGQASRLPSKSDST
jgi:hypothetical protein